VCIIIMGEKIRSDDPILQELQKKWIELKNKK